MRKIKINPKYEYLRAFIESIPDIFEKEGKEIYHQRNIIKVLSAPDGTIVNIKRFHQPRSLNRLIYSWNIRVPKGQRAYDYSFLLYMISKMRNQENMNNWQNSLHATQPKCILQGLCTRTLRQAIFFGKKTTRASIS